MTKARDLANLATTATTVATTTSVNAALEAVVIEDVMDSK